MSLPFSLAAATPSNATKTASRLPQTLTSCATRLAGITRVYVDQCKWLAQTRSRSRPTAENPCKSFDVHLTGQRTGTANAAAAAGVTTNNIAASIHQARSGQDDVTPARIAAESRNHGAFLLAFLRVICWPRESLSFYSFCLHGTPQIAATLMHVKRNAIVVSWPQL